MACAQYVVRHLRVVALLASLLALIPAGDAAAEPEQPGNPFVFGIASHAWWLDPEVYGDQLFPALDDLHTTSVRLSIDWRRFEPQQGVFDWGQYDRVLGELAKRNIVIVATFNTIPGWASVNQPGCDNPVFEIIECELREDMRPAFENAIRAALTRYTWIKHWEFWNEPEMWRRLGEDGTVYIRNLRTFYDIAHAINPEVVVASQTLVGEEYQRYIYNLSESFYGPDNEPWDAVSIHPYNWNYQYQPGERHFELNYDRILGLRQLMLDRGDGAKPIWITEFGWNTSVETQAANLTYTLDWLKRQPFIQFAHLHMLHDWTPYQADAFGLMAIEPGPDGGLSLSPETRFVPKAPFYNAFKEGAEAAWDNLPFQPGPENAEVVTFPETGHTLSGRFREAWEARGGLRILGYPITRPYARQQADGSWLYVQDFERARLEFHPAYLGGWGEVLGTLAGRDLTIGREMEPPFVPLAACQATPDRNCFGLTGHSLSGTFREFWNKHGGLATFGYPLSEEFEEGGVTVQYFERARLEHHPENAGTEYEVLLGLLVENQLEADGWMWPSLTSRLPTLREFE